MGQRTNFDPPTYTNEHIYKISLGMLLFLLLPKITRMRENEEKNVPRIKMGMIKEKKMKIHREFFFVVKAFV